MSEALLLEKYKGLMFLDPNTKVNFIVYEDNLEFRREVDGIRLATLLMIVWKMRGL